MTDFYEPTLRIESIGPLSLFNVEISQISSDSEKSFIFGSKARSWLSDFTARMHSAIGLQLPSNALPALCMVPHSAEGDKETSVKETLRYVYEESANNADAKALGFLFNEIEEAFEQKNVRFVDALLADFEPKRVKPLVSMGLLRGTFRARLLLESWEPCLARVEEELRNNNESVDKLLIGLRKKNG